jgi:hypothetical protein
MTRGLVLLVTLMLFVCVLCILGLKRGSSRREGEEGNLVGVRKEVMRAGQICMSVRFS